MFCPFSADTLAHVKNILNALPVPGRNSHSNVRVVKTYLMFAHIDPPSGWNCPGRNAMDHKDDESVVYRRPGIRRVTYLFKVPSQSL